MSGKTSTARILAKALNAELDPHGDPLPDTDTAIAIDEGRYMDLIEIDAASNRGVNDIRDLRERVLLRPTIGDYKVYIIDEVHMLTTEAFNALLKTLEEPPPQVVMILATTDIHRVPATIISRCQRFDFRRLTADDVIGRLILICDEEEIDCEPSVLELVAQSAWGSLRDAENLLEQLAISYGSGEIVEAQARELLGIGDTSSARNFGERHTPQRHQARARNHRGRSVTRRRTQGATRIDDLCIKGSAARKARGQQRLRATRRRARSRT